MSADMNINATTKSVPPMSNPTDERVTVHYGPVYGPRLLPPGESFAACRPGAVSGNLTTHKPWVTCLKCTKTEAYRNGK